VSEPLFLTVSQVLRLHVRSIEEFGGTMGIRDLGGLRAAVHQPQNVFFYGGGDLYDISAAYAFHIAESQSFLDGNKRTGIGAAIAFLRLNGVKTMFDELKLYDLLIGIAEKRVTKADLADYLRRTAEAS
jgi:death-on-curing protein